MGQGPVTRTLCPSDCLSSAQPGQLEALTFPSQERTGASPWLVGLSRGLAGRAGKSGPGEAGWWPSTRVAQRCWWRRECSLCLRDRPHVRIPRGAEKGGKPRAAPHGGSDCLGPSQPP